MTKEELISGKPFKVKGSNEITYKIDGGCIMSTLSGFEIWRYECSVNEITEKRISVISILVGEKVEASFYLSEILAA